MMSGVLQRWMKDWDITHRPSSAYFPHSNNRGETAVKSSKRMLQDCVSRAGSIDNDKFVKAILQYQNTPPHTRTAGDPQPRWSSEGP